MKRRRLFLGIASGTIVFAMTLLVIRMSLRTPRHLHGTMTSPTMIDTVAAQETSPSVKTEEKGLEPEFIEAIPVTYHPDEAYKIAMQVDSVITIKVSPSGQRILYIAKRGNRHIVGMVDLLGNKQSIFELGFDDCADAAWSADGKKIVLAGKKNGYWEIYLYKLESKTLNQVTADPNRKKKWPRFSPYKFDGHHRIAYVSEKDNRRDIWWVRESGQYDMPITQANSEYDSSDYWNSLMPPPPAVTVGGGAPEWAPSGNLLLYRTSNGYSVLGYTFFSWWKKQHLGVPKTEAVVTWSPNQTAFLLYDSRKQSAYLSQRSDLSNTKQVVTTPISAIGYFPDGKAFAYATKEGGQQFIEIQPYDDPMGDVANLWMFPYSESQQEKIAKNQLLFLDAGFEQIYNLYETERYYCGAVDPNFPARPYFITSDAVLETFYSAFAALYGAMERSRLASLLKEFSRKAMAAALAKKAPKDAVVFFETGVGLLEPQARSTLSPEAAVEVARIEAATAKTESLWGKKIDYSDFYIRGKYERDSDMQGYFRAVKWYQAFTFDLDSTNDRKLAAEINSIAHSPAVLHSLERIHAIYGQMVGESRYFTPLNIKNIPPSGGLLTFKPNLPWIRIINYYRLFPSIYTLDAYVFDELVTHLNRPVTVGSAKNPRLLPKGLDIMAGLASSEAFEILSKEFNEVRFANYQTTLSNIRNKIAGFNEKAWDANLYQRWLYVLQSLVREPEGICPAFTKTSAWKRKQLNTALGSWVNLRYETIAVVEQTAAECGEGGYERLNIGKPKGYVEPNPEFFKRLDEGFAKIGGLMQQAFDDSALSSAAQGRVADYRIQIQSLGKMAQKELEGKELTNEEYEQITEIGGTIEQFILIMGCLNGNRNEHAVRLPDPICKIVDVQKDGINGVRLYEALGNANEIDVIVPFFGRRQIAKGSVYSYYEFVSRKDYNSKMWQAEKDKTLPRWISGLYDGNSNPPLYNLPDLRKQE